MTPFLFLEFPYGYALARSRLTHTHTQVRSEDAFSYQNKVKPVLEHQPEPAWTVEVTRQESRAAGGGAYYIFLHSFILSPLRAAPGRARFPLNKVATLPVR